MLSEIKQFDRGDHTLFINTGTGEKWTELKGKSKRPNMVRRAVNYVTAATQHVKAGRPKAEAETVAGRFAICLDCPSDKFEILAEESIPDRLKHLPIVGTCTHKSCGCFLHGEANGRDKLTWADQACPMNHWSKAEPKIEAAACTKTGCC